MGEAALNTNKDEGKPQRRLENFRIKEVSLVDEAANNRKFLIVKSKDVAERDKEIFKEEVPENESKVVAESESKVVKEENTEEKKNVDISTFANLVVMAEDLQNTMSAFIDDVRQLKVEDSGHDNMGPDLTGRAVSMLEKLTEVLFTFGSDSTLGFDSPSLMAKHYLERERKEVEKVGRAMSSTKIKRLRDVLMAFEAGLKSMRSFIKDMEFFKEAEMQEDKTKKEAELQKRMVAEEAKIRKELDLEEEKPSPKVEAKGAEDAPKVEAKEEGKKENVSEVENLKKENEVLRAKLEKTENGELTQLEKRLHALESAGSTNVQEEEVEKNKTEEVEYIQKGQVKYRKGLFKGIMGKPLSAFLPSDGKKY